MKKVLYFAAIAAMFAACSSEELEQSAIQQDAKGTPVNFSIYTARNTRAGQAGTITTDGLKTGAFKDTGFGVFAYYTAGEKYDAKATPNFMYNEQVTWNADKWVYEPVKYWPNEFGNSAISDDVDYLTFFAYAPFTKVAPTTGEVDVTGIAAEALDNYQNKNIIKVSKNTEMGDPIIKYVVDTDPATSVDLLWGVAAETPDGYYKPIATGLADAVTAGMPFINLIKPGDPVDNKIKFNLRHSLAKVKFTIDYVADKTLQDGTKPTESEAIDSATTRIYVRALTIDGFATEGTLNLNNTTANQPLWKALDGVTDLSFDEIRFLDGRKDGKEGTQSGEAASEKPQGLAKYLLENASANAPLVDDNGTPTDPLDDKCSFKNQNKYPGIKPFKTGEEYPLFEGDLSKNDGYFYVIPRNTDNQGVNIKLEYDVQTIDQNLASKLADNATLGSLIPNIIEKRNIFGDKIDFKAGFVYTINIHVGMTSVKIDATVQPWDDTTYSAQPNLPYNNVAP